MAQSLVVGGRVRASVVQRSRVRAWLAAAAMAAVAADAATAQDEEEEEAFDGVVISDDLTAPIDTATADQTDPDNPLPANVLLESGGSVILDASVEDGEARNPAFDGLTAVTINSSNTFTNEGVVRIIDALPDADGTEVVGLRADTDAIGGPSFIFNSGTIEVLETFVREDLDDDGDVDGPLAEGFGRVGVLVEGAAAFEGDVIGDSSSAVRVEGDDSTAVRLAAPINGDVILEGTTSAVGDRSIALDIQQAVSGDVFTRGAVTANGEDAGAVRVRGDVGGNVNLSGTVTTTGFESTFITNATDPDSLDDGEEPFTLDDDALDLGAEAVLVEASVGDGVLVSGPISGFDSDNVEDDPDTPEDESDVEDPLDLNVEFNINRRTGQIVSTGSAPALRVQPADGGGDITLGVVREEIRDVSDQDEDLNTDEIVAVVTADAAFTIPVGDTTFDENAIIILLTEDEAYGLINRGSIIANGLNAGFTATAVDIRGSNDGASGVVVEGGFLNDSGSATSGTISASAFEADATAIVIGANADVARIDNLGTITATVSAEAPAAVDDPATLFDDTAIEEAVGVDIEAGAAVASITNDGVITAQVRGDHAVAVALRDASGSVETITNTNRIQALFLSDGDDDDGDGDETDSNTDPDPDTGLAERTGQAIAVDLRGPDDGVGVAFTQDYRALFDENGEQLVADSNNDDQIDLDDVAEPLIIGDVFFGDADDTFNLLAGSVVGDIDFGLGDDTFALIGRPELDEEDQPQFVGRIADPDGSLVLIVENSTLEATNATSADPVRLASLDLRDGARVRVSVEFSDDAVETNATRFTVSGAARIASGAQITPEFTGLTRESQAVIIEAASLEDENGQPLSAEDVNALLGADAPFVYNVALTTDDGQTITLDATLRTAEELGLNANQTAAYDPVIAAAIADKEVGAALANIGDPDPVEARAAFLSAYNQLLPDFSGASLELSVAAVDGAFGAVANRLSALRGDQGALGGVWAQEYFVYLDRAESADNPGFRGQGFAVAAGVDRPLGPFYAAGLSFSFGASEFEDHTSFDDETTLTTFQLGAYASSRRGPFIADVYGGVGLNNFESSRNIIFGSEGTAELDRQATADWRSYFGNATARLGAEFDMGWIVLTPLLSGTYLYIEEEGYKEEGGGALNIAVDPRTLEAGSASAVLSVGRRFGRNRATWWAPQLRFGYREELGFDTPETLIRFVNDDGAPVLDPDTGLPLDAVALRAADLPESAGIVGFSFAAGTDYSSFAFDVDADVRDGFGRYTSRFTFRFLF